MEFDKLPILIGERINPTGKRKLKEALRSFDLDYILEEGIGQADRGAHVLDVNVGLPEINETQMLTRVVCELQAVCDLPLQIDTADADAMEASLRRYNGKAMINSVNGKKESMSAVFPLVKKYGGVVVALTLDENGIPESAEGRIEIAERILSIAAEYGIDKKDIIFDPLAMTVSADPRAAIETLCAVRKLTDMGCKTSLGVSNVSFGLPTREWVNSTFFAMAMQNGLSAAIMNPYSVEMKKAWHTFRALAMLDENCADYIAFSSSVSEVAPTHTENRAQAHAEEFASEFQGAIIKGLTARAGEIALGLLDNGVEPLSLVENEIIPALDRVGKGFEEKTVYLPSLLMSAEAAKAAFAEIKKKMSGETEGENEKAKIVLATVHGDIHDIGKNIVRLLLENYGFGVIDLGRDVPPEDIVQSALTSGARLVGLSALMTTTVPAMEQTIKLLRERAPECKVIVGGAVLNAEYAERIGADAYCKDAMQAVRYAEAFFKGE
ncbi:MAG: dihydropteroate synthase [Clostridia bacterium]|nr:dihydropteroate synthase [Clostridia bacterium]